ncbi:putative photosynthetic complex assembly protein PuhE [Rhodobacter ferrooxidans]|uniref:Photosynthetic complex assembly protein 2 n=1 Tax=Rhodobacter ferrooxidans TaxID=371731 RepID=C8RYL9_9RHOB|nr:putative photosynthetic complex assembly protein PuhE [Rhodobacter sp. SW2]EEW26207.1 photosynthetic complex assembly protein 2 [Rhodobacter sp. SW2]
MTDNPWLATLTAIFLWWFSTGIILWRVRVADNGGPEQHLVSVVLGLPLLAAGIWGVNVTLTDTSTFGAYVGFLSALAIWGWIELAFLSGIITGPNRSRCPPDASDRQRFVRGFGTLAWHEGLLVLALVLLAFATRDLHHPFALWTFSILFFARISAKLNLFFGVPRINVEFLSTPLLHLPSHFRRGRVNLFYPFSITVLSFSAACFLERLVSAPTPASTTGFTLLTALTLLALLEHWFMVVPLPDQKLWRWMIPAPKVIPPELLQEDGNGL